ncbi:unnamed protein product [Diatraea saccharalis]|uniref:Uncharacterized protein n=1 Tax=Diatraea saccharalis TaxID=40085 RepID=A0A9N9QX23_9NEOP|nr:unnamed protein product [Diatraea saccharalis]
MGLRSGKNNIVDSLLYVEYDNKGKILNRFPMRSLADVKHFFEISRDVEICYDYCPGEEPLIERSGAELFDLSSTLSTVNGPQPISEAAIAGGIRSERSSVV